MRKSTKSSARTVKSGAWLAVAGLVAVLLAGCGGAGSASGGGSGRVSTDMKATTAKASASPPTTAAATSGRVYSGTAAVTITTAFTFDPKTVTVRPGTTVTWTNRGGDAIHVIKDLSPLHTPASDGLKNGGTFSITYRAPGSYPYECGIHNYMTGTVVVVP